MEGMAQEENSAPEPDSDDDPCDEDVPVFDLRCGACEHLFCRRGMCVHLVADASALLFSTDFRPTGVVEAEAEREHGCCQCRVRDVACRCGHIVGYHVIRPCSTCNAAGHNDHYWQMNRGMVLAERRLDDEGRPVTWSSASCISLELAPPPSPQAPTSPVQALASPEALPTPMATPGGAGLPAEVPLDLCCPICHELMTEPRWAPCRHAACLRCLTRAVDLRRECPCCRRPTTCAELVPAEAVAARVNALLAAMGGGPAG